MPSAGGDLSRDGLCSTLERRSYRYPSPRPSSVLPARQETATTEDQDHRRDHNHRRERVYYRAHTELDHGVDLQRKRARSDPGDEERYYEVVEGEGKREQCPGHDARQDKRERYPQEGLYGGRPEVLGRLLDGAVHPGEPRPHDDSNERDAEGHMGDDDGYYSELDCCRDEEDQEADPDDYLGHHGRRVDRRVGERLAPEIVSRERERGERAYDRGDGGGRKADYERELERVEDRPVTDQLPVPLHREPRPYLGVLGRVEREEDKDHDRGVEEEVYEAGEKEQGPVRDLAESP